MREKMFNRWIILLAASLCNFCLGGAYAWSVFQKPLISMYHWTPSEVSMAFTLCYVLMAVAMIVAGRIQDRQGPKRLLLVGGIMWGGGILLAGFATTLWQLYVAYGVVSGLGNGIMYSCTVANTIKWFPDKKGLATGLVVAAAGVGAVVSAPLVSLLVYGYGVAWALKILGAFYITVVFCAVKFVERPPADYQPVGWNPSETISTVGLNDRNWQQMLVDPLFYVLWVMYALGAAAGLMVLGHAASIGQEVFHLSAALAALAVSIISLANTCGRLFWGYISDKIGRYGALLGIYMLSTVSMAALTQVEKFYPFVLVIFVVGLCFGGIIALFPSIAADLFGSKHLGLNYGILFTGFAAAAVIGPRLAAKCKEIEGDYMLAFIGAAILSSCCMLLTLFVMWRTKARAQQQPLQPFARPEKS